MHCTDSGLPGGNIYAYQMDDSTDSYKAWDNFNAWWPFLPQSAVSTCPPKVGVQGIQVSSTDLPREDRQTLECGYQNVNGQSLPAMALSYPANVAAFVLAQGAPGTSLAALLTWWNRVGTGITPAPTTAPDAAVAVASLVELLPGDIDDPASLCSMAQPKFTPVGLVQS